MDGWSGSAAAIAAARRFRGPTRPIRGDPGAPGARGDALPEGRRRRPSGARGDRRRSALGCAELLRAVRRPATGRRAAGAVGGPSFRGRGGGVGRPSSGSRRAGRPPGRAGRRPWRSGRGRGSEGTIQCTVQGTGNRWKMSRYRAHEYSPVRTREGAEKPPPCLRLRRGQGGGEWAVPARRDPQAGNVRRPCVRPRPRRRARRPPSSRRGPPDGRPAGAARRGSRGRAGTPRPRPSTPGRAATRPPR